MFSGMSKLHCSPYYVACMQAMTELTLSRTNKRQTCNLLLAHSAMGVEVSTMQSTYFAYLNRF